MHTGACVRPPANKKNPRPGALSRHMKGNGNYPITAHVFTGAHRFASFYFCEQRGSLKDKNKTLKTLSANSSSRAVWRRVKKRRHDHAKHAQRRKKGRTKPQRLKAPHSLRSQLGVFVSFYSLSASTLAAPSQ